MAISDISSYIGRETHYELIRRGYRWDDERRAFKELSPESYQTVRDKVIDAYIGLAIDCFKDYSRCLIPPHGSLEFRMMGVHD